MEVIIVDANILNRKKLVDLISNLKHWNLVEEYSNGRIAISEINRLKPQIIFVSVELNDINGFQVYQNIKIKPLPIVVFHSSFSENALKAFDFGAFDFLLRPFQEDRFHQTAVKIDEEFKKRVPEIENAQSNMDKEPERDNKKTTKSHLPIRIGNKTLLLNLSSIKYITASGSYAEIYTNDEKFIVRDSLNNLMTILDRDRFFRVSRSYIIHLPFIKEIVHSNYSEIDVRMLDENLIRVSKSQKLDFFERIGYQ